MSPLVRSGLVSIAREAVNLMEKPPTNLRILFAATSSPPSSPRAMWLRRMVERSSKDEGRIRSSRMLWGIFLMAYVVSVCLSLIEGTKSSVAG